jgi:hypothetical protein
VCCCPWGSFRFLLLFHVVWKNSISCLISALEWMEKETRFLAGSSAELDYTYRQKGGCPALQGLDAAACVEQSSMLSVGFVLCFVIRRSDDEISSFHFFPRY